jgi:hypothetical protein
MEAYYSLIYLSLPNIPPEEPGFKSVLWHYHDAFERHEALRIGLPQSGVAQKLKLHLDAARAALEGSAYFQKLKERHRENLLHGKDFKLLDNIELSRRAKINPAYYRMQYKFCSAFSHTAPFSISLMGSFKAGATESKRVLATLVATAGVYTALGIRDFTNVFSEAKARIPSQVMESISVAEHIANWEFTDPELSQAEHPSS